MDEQRIPNQASNQEQAEGSRETVNANDESEREERDRFDNSDTESGGRDDQAGGITNRPLDEEIANQREVPPRGEVKAPGRGHA
jgi:hypothetical protein